MRKTARTCLLLLTLAMFCNIDICQAERASSTSVKPPPAPKSIIDLLRDAGKSVVLISGEGQGVTTQGSGVVIRKEGIIVTNYHVIKNIHKGSVRTTSSEVAVIEGIIEFDEKRDIAILKAKGSNFVAAQLGDSSKVQVGQRIIAIGNPYGLQNSVSDGVVSGVRSIEGFKILQITAPISLGSSGGALLNERGEVIGLTFASVKDGQNLNFAIPINYIKPMIGTEITKKLEETGTKIHSSQEVLNEKFLDTYLELSEKILQSMSDLLRAEGNTWKDDSLTADTLFYQTKSRLEGLSSIYNLKAMQASTDIERSTQAKLIDVLLKLVESSNAFIHAYDVKRDIDFNLKNARASLAEAINLYFESCGKVLSTKLPPGPSERLGRTLRAHPLHSIGTPYDGMRSVPYEGNRRLIICVYPNSPAFDAGVKELDSYEAISQDDVKPKLAERLYKPSTFTLQREANYLQLTIKPIRFGFKDKPIVLGIAKFENESMSPHAHHVLRNYLISALNNFDNLVAVGTKSTSETFSSEAESNAIDYFIVVKITKCQGDPVHDFWTYQVVRHNIKVLAELQVYNAKGALKETTKLKEQKLPSPTGTEDDIYRAVLRKVVTQIIASLKETLKF